MYGISNGGINIKHLLQPTGQVQSLHNMGGSTCPTCVCVHVQYHRIVAGTRVLQYSDTCCSSSPLHWSCSLLLSAFSHRKPTRLSFYLLHPEPPSFPAPEIYIGALLCYVSMDREIQIWSPRELCIWQGVRAEDWEAQIGEHTFFGYEMEQMLIMDPFQHRAQVCPSEGWSPAGERSRFVRPPSQRPT